MGESINFHLIFPVSVLYRLTEHNPSPFHPEKRVIVLEIDTVLNAAEIAVLIVVQHRGDFCGPRVRIVEVPVSYRLRFVTRSGVGGNTCFVTDRI